MIRDKVNYVSLTNLRPRNTLKPSTNSKMMSTKLADTMIRSNMFQPHRKKSFDSAINLIMHSNVKIDVNTCKFRIKLNVILKFRIDRIV